MTNPDFRALCAELVEKLDALNCSYNIPSQSALIARARAALDQPVAPTDRELMDLAEAGGSQLVAAQLAAVG